MKKLPLAALLFTSAISLGVSSFSVALIARLFLTSRSGDPWDSLEEEMSSVILARGMAGFWFFLSLIQAALLGYLYFKFFDKDPSYTLKKWLGSMASK